MYKSLLNTNFNVKNIMMGQICYSKQNFVRSNPHTKFCVNKKMANSNLFHVNCYLEVTCNILLSIRNKIQIMLC